jgi:hypothetical protein
VPSCEHIGFNMQVVDPLLFGDDAATSANFATEM